MVSKPLGRRLARSLLIQTNKAPQDRKPAARGLEFAVDWGFVRGTSAAGFQRLGGQKVPKGTRVTDGARSPTRDGKPLSFLMSRFGHDAPMWQVRASCIPTASGRFVTALALGLPAS